MSAKRAVIRLELEVSVKNALDELCERRGMTQISVVSRLVRWLLRQDEIVQASIVNLLPEEVLGELSHILLKRLATSLPGGETGHARGRPAEKDAKDATLATRPIDH
jgi:hypothetical protein